MPPTGPDRKRPAPSPTHSSSRLKVPRTTPSSVSSSGTDTKAYKGLRHFSLMVCKKVQAKGTTTYNEVADELVQETSKLPGAFDEKNLRRRVYDALNVLMALDIITRQRKEITWKGLTAAVVAPVDPVMLQQEIEMRRASINKKRDALKELIIQQTCFRNLVERNRDAAPPVEPDNKIPLPFIVVNTSSSAVIRCEMSSDLTDVMFDFSTTFEINDDNTILKRLGMHHATLPDLKQWVPPDVLKYSQEHSLTSDVLVPPPAAAKAS